MQLSSHMVLGLLALLPLTAWAGPKYEECLDQPKPADCVARMGAQASGASPEHVLAAVLRHGLVDLVPSKSVKLLRGLRGSFIGPEDLANSRLAKLFESSGTEALANAGARRQLAAIALLSASRYETDPFTNPLVVKLLKKADDDPVVPVLALVVWSEVLGSGPPWEESVSIAGMPAIWQRTELLKEKAPELVRDVAGFTAFLGQVKPQIRDFYIWYAEHPGATPSIKAEAASEMARYFGLADQAARLMQQGGDLAPDYDVPGIYGSIAAARMTQGYDQQSAKFLAALLLEGVLRNEGDIGALDEREFALLGRVGAKEELREIGTELQARAEDRAPRVESADWFASASECFRLAGDLERAREAARLGLPYVSEIVQARVSQESGVDRTNPAAMANEALGYGTRPVIALYRTGAIDEAVKTGYLTGGNRYKNAALAGEKVNPQWAIDDKHWQGLNSMMYDLERSQDPVLPRNVYAALVRSCKASLPECRDKTLLNIGLAAAAMGDEPRMREAFAANLRQFSGQRDQSWYALRLAAHWAHAEELLAKKTAVAR